MKTYFINYKIPNTKNEVQALEQKIEGVISCENTNELIAYIDQDHHVRGVDNATSVQLYRDSTTFNQLLQKWSDPF